jgi:hypothetical protein
MIPRRERQSYSAHPRKYPKYWGAIADHSGDACFDFVYGQNTKII